MSRRARFTFRSAKYIIRNFRFQLYAWAKPYASRPLVSASDRLGHDWVASAARLAVSLTCLVCFSPPTCLAADTCPHWFTSERSFVVSPNSLAVRQYCGATLASGLGAPQTGEAFGDEEGTGGRGVGGIGRKNGSSGFGILGRGRTGSFGGRRRHRALKTGLKHCRRRQSLLYYPSVGKPKWKSSLTYVPELPSYALAYQFYPGAEEAMVRAIFGANMIHR